MMLASYRYKIANSSLLNYTKDFQNRKTLLLLSTANINSKSFLFLKVSEID